MSLEEIEGAAEGGAEGGRGGGSANAAWLSI